MKPRDKLPALTLGQLIEAAVIRSLDARKPKQHLLARLEREWERLRRYYPDEQNAQN